MNQFQSTLGRVCLVLALAGCFLSAALYGADRPIRLRQGAFSEAVAPLPASRSALFLVQFTGPVEPQWRVACQHLGVQLVRYIPEDTFVVRMRGGALAQVRALPFVRRVGPFRPAHKLGPGLPLPGVGGGGGGQPVELPIAVLCVREAPAADLASVRGMLRRQEGEQATRFGTILRGVIGAQQLERLLESDCVLWVEPAPRIQLFDEESTKIVAGDDGFRGTLAVLHQQGLDGRGVTVAVADSGLDDGVAASMHPDLFGRVPAFFFYNNLEDASDEHGHGTHVAGIVAGNAALGDKDDFGALYGLGVAPRARIVAQRIFDGVGNYEPPPSFERLTRDAVRAGAQIGSNSWGDDTQGRYDLSAMEFDALVRDSDGLTPGDQPYILEFSAGNAGPGFQTIGSPAVGKNVIATGASQNNRPDLFIYAEGQEAMADFSSRGPCEDGRIKPDLVAPGTWIASLQSSAATDENAWLGISPDYQFQGGTSQAGPHVSGGAAVFVQYYRQTHTNATPSPALVKAGLINSAVDMDDEEGGTGPVPNTDEGWGRMDLEELLLSERQYDYIDQTVWLTTGQTFEHQVVVGDPGQPLKITLVYTDVPGFPGAIPALVNDLDLEIVAPDGRFYRGNQFSSGVSVPNPASTDSVNNVEGVHLPTPLPGEYIIRVHARNVPEDAIQASAAVDQDFALVVSASVPFPGTGLVFLDRPAYRAPGTALIRLIDSDLAGQPSAVVTIRSSTEPGSQPVFLTPVSANGSFTGSVALVSVPPASDGVLSIAHGDLIEVSYFDASLGETRKATAQADFLPPVVSGVQTAQALGRSSVLFNTDEPATSIVYFGPDPSLPFSVTNVTFTQAHELALPALVGGQTYYFAVVAVDGAGNVVSNDNAGLLFQFVAPVVAPILLVDAYLDDPIFGVPPISGYTDALDLAGLDYELWDVLALGASPTVEDLRPFGAVMWRLPEFAGTFSPAEMGAITNYLAGGGSLFVASMEALSLLDFLGFSEFRRNVLQVESFTDWVGVPDVEGLPGESITEGMSMLLDYTAYEDEFKEFAGLDADISDILIPSTNAAPIFLSAGDPVGLRFPAPGVESPGRLIFLSIPFDAMPLSGSGPNNRVEFLRRAIRFLTPVAGESDIQLDRPVYTIPSLVTVEVSDLDRAQLGPLQAHVSSQADPAGRTIVLTETVRRGVFRGRVTLVAPGSGGSTNDLSVSPTDTIVARYQDVSAGQERTVEAHIELDPPEITAVEHEPSYVDAVVRWETSELADSLVQFGESIFLERVAHARGLRTSHEVVLSGLRPDKVYFYRVVSRDQAGNTTVDDNQGQHYTFRTLRPILPDWMDNLEGTDENWTVVDTELSETSWQWGVPQNGETAHSPSRAWGSNLNGISSGFDETFLISPPIQLLGGNVAKLRFWENYDFTFGDSDLIVGGEVLLITNVSIAPVLLGTNPFEESGGWVPAEYDLTPYVGQLVYVVWHYVLFTFEDRPRIGWLVDDISITVSNVVPGTITISNNISQASFVLEGPTSRTTQGRYLQLPNAIAGDYQITYGEVPYYQTPAPQSASLASGGTIFFQGNYTFVDSNSNGMSDPWEQAFFNELSPQRTATTDTDNDGRTDLVEFMAGTDPTRAISILVVAMPEILPDNRVRLQWAGIANRDYRVQSSQNGSVWTSIDNWVRARVNGPITQTVVPPENASLFLLRVEVRP